MNGLKALKLNIACVTKEKSAATKITHLLNLATLRTFMHHLESQHLQVNQLISPNASKSEVEDGPQLPRHLTLIVKST